MKNKDLLKPVRFDINANADEVTMLPGKFTLHGETWVHVTTDEEKKELKKLLGEKYDIQGVRRFS